MRLYSRREAFVFWYGAIAQLGERVLCKHEVVGSIPSGSTRWFDRRGIMIPIVVRETSLRTRCLHRHACGISDIVKRRSIRVWDLRSNSRALNRNLQVISALAHRKMDEL